jgi:hypothetical protein
MKKKPLVIYWAPIYDPPSGLSIFFEDPVNLYSDLVLQKEPASGRKSLFSCPAVADRMKNSFVFKNTLKTKIEYDFSNPEAPIVKKIYGHDPIVAKRSSLVGGSYFLINMGWIFFSEEPVTALVNSPMMHKPTNFSKNAFFPIGKMNIGKWFRPISHEMQLWDSSGTLEIDEGDPLFYLEILSDRKVELRKFKMDQDLLILMHACTKSTNLLGRNTSLEERYKKFMNSKSNKLVLESIKKNLI